MSDPLAATILLLADLHLGNSYFGEAQLPPLDYPLLVRLLGLSRRMKRFFSTRCVAHNHAILSQLPQYLTAQLYRFRATEEYTGYEFDHYLLLGDLVTWSNPESFAFLNEYLTQAEVEVRLKDRVDKRPGLKLPLDRTLVIPGNHDKILRSDLEIYNDAFCRPLQLPIASVGGVTLVDTTLGGRRVLFLTVDANAYASQPLTVNFAARTHLAKGNVTDATVREAESYKATLANARRDGALCVLVIHYAMDLSRATNMAADLAAVNYVLPHECAGVARLMEELGNSALSFAVHGHLHVPQLYNFHGTPTVSVGTATQSSNGGEQPNAFHILKIKKSGQVLAEHHLWTGSGFILDEDRSRSGPLN